MVNLFAVFNGGADPDFTLDDLVSGADLRYDERFNRTSPFLTHPVFNKHHSETELLRYMYKLQSRDLSLVHSMIPLGSCTMKLNATAEMMPITWPGFAKIHPFAPLDQTDGYQQLFDELEAGAGGDHRFCRECRCSRMRARRANTRGCWRFTAITRRAARASRNVCLIPQSAHGTNPASAVMAGMKVVVVKTDAKRQHRRRRSARKGGRARRRSRRR